jgi:hypothetical protein
MVVPLSGGICLRAVVRDRQLNLWPVSAGHGLAPAWSTERSDQRNSGAYPLRGDLSAAPETAARDLTLSVYPNPGRGRFQIHLPDKSETGSYQVQVFDLRGRRLKTLAFDDTKNIWNWDGTDQMGRRVAAGTYFAVARQGQQQISTRFVLTR